IDSISASSYVTEADCRLETSLTLNTWFVNARSSAAENRVSLDPAIAEACVHRFDAGACASPAATYPDPFGILTTCVDPFVGQVPAGSPCRGLDECVPGSRCVSGGQTVASYGNLTPESIQPIPTVQSVSAGVRSCLPCGPKGGKCRVTYVCAPGTYCRGVDFVCAEPAELVTPCHPLNDPSGIPSLGPPCDDVNHQLVCLGDVCG